MQADLGDGPGDCLQRLVEPVDWKGRRARPDVGLDSCFQHVNIVPAALSTSSAADADALSLVEQGPLNGSRGQLDPKTTRRANGTEGELTA